MQIRDSLQKRLNAHQVKYEALRRDIQVLDNMIARYGEESQTSLDISPNGSKATRFIGKTLKFCVQRALQEKFPDSLRAGEIRDILFEGGYTTESPNFDGAVWAMLSHLTKSSLIIKDSPGKYKSPVGMPVTYVIDDK